MIPMLEHSELGKEIGQICQLKVLMRTRSYGYVYQIQDISVDEK